VYCQLVHICGCIPARIRHALADLPETLDGTYERTLREINKADWDFAHRLLQFVAVVTYPLCVEELAELFAFDFKAGSIPKFHDDWRLEDPIHAVMSTCPGFLAIVDDKVMPGHKVVQFSHFSVKEFLTSTRLAESNNIILRRYHISERSAHSLVARACSGYLLHLDNDITIYSLRKLPFASYLASAWAKHARLGDLSQNVKDGLKELFDPNKPHLAVCILICGWDPIRPHSYSRPRSERLSPLCGTPLHYAACWDLHSIVELLVNEHSQDVNSQNSILSATPLHLASERGHLEMARTLIERGASVSARKYEGRTPLHLASYSGWPEVTRMLIERGADVSAKDKDGQTPLHLASQSGRLEVAHMLIERGAGVSARNKDGRTPLHLLSFGEFSYLVCGEPRSHPKVARMLIERGADVSAQDKDGQTPLRLALQAGQLEVACILIEHGAAVSAPNKDGQTLLHLELKTGQLKAARMLIEHGANLSAQNKDGQTPLHSLSARNCVKYLNSMEPSRPEVARMLIDRGADVSAQDKDGQTPVHLASQAGQLEVARILIECSASVSARNKNGQTPLHMVSLSNRAPYLDSEKSDHPEVARMLIEHGADVSAQDKDGRTPVQLALQAKQVKVTHILVEHGASLPAENNDGNPLHMGYLGNSGPSSGNFSRSAVARRFNRPGADVSVQNRMRGGRERGHRRGREEGEEDEEGTRRSTRRRT
jgi:ankyrin repeat protein